MSARLAACMACGFLFVSASSAFAANPQLADRLGLIRKQVLNLEQGLIESLRSHKQTKDQVRKIHTLLELQKQERILGQKRLSELEKTVKELESRRVQLNQKIKVQQKTIRNFLAAIDRSVESQATALQMDELEAPRRKVLANLVDRGLKEIEELKVDLDDADQLEGRIMEEKQQIAYLLQDLNEQAGVLELNRQLQVDILQKKHQERLSQLENYRRLKSAESQVESLIQQFNARLELEKSAETEKLASRAMTQGAFAKLKGKLSLPVMGAKILSRFGKTFDSKSGLYIFKKGIEMEVGKKVPVAAISAGKIAYSGELPDYGRVAIIDHGDHFYTLCARIGELTRKTGDSVAAGDAIGLTDEQGTPLYFEIRSRNVAVNPLQWVSN